MFQSLRLYIGKSPLLLIIFLIVTDLGIVLDAPFLRQFLGFTFFTIIPGLLILYLLRLERPGVTEKLVFSVGLSVSFLMLFGLIINSIYPLFGYNTPLSTNSLLISFSVILLGLIILAHLTNRAPAFSGLSNFKINTKEKALFLLPAFFPLLSILGMRVMNVTDNNVMLMVLLLLIPAYIILISVYHSRVPERIYPILIYLIGFSVLMLVALRSNHLMGSDVHLEYYTFIKTASNLRWSLAETGPLGVVLSTSLLPAIYQSFLNINPEYLFKIFYPLILSVSPLAVYALSQKYVGSLYAFLASFFFIAQPVFLWTPAHARTNIAVLFSVLTIMTIFHDGINEFAKRVLFMVFSVSVILSHYTTTFITFFLLLFTWLGMQIFTLVVSTRRKPKTSFGNPIGSGDRVYNEVVRTATTPPKRFVSRNQLTGTAIALFFVMLFFWYSQLTGAPFRSAVGFFRETLISLQYFFVLEARSQYTQVALGAAPLTKGIPQQIQFIINWITVVFIAIGVFVTLGRFRKMVATSNNGSEKPWFLLQKLNTEYFMLSLVCCALLVASIALPYASLAYSMDRTKFQVIAFLSLFFVIGGIILGNYLKSLCYWPIVLVLVLYFLGTTGMMYQLWSIPQRITLNSEGQEYDTLYVHDQESYAASWLKQHIIGMPPIYIDSSYRKLVSQGMIPESQERPLLASYREGVKIGGYIFLRYQTIVKGELASGDEVYDISEFPGMFDGKNKIYATNGSEIYR